MVFSFEFVEGQIVINQLDYLDLVMTNIEVTIKKKKALKILEELRANDLIDFANHKDGGKSSIETHFASEKTLARDWLSKKEEEAWRSL